MWDDIQQSFKWFSNHLYAFFDFSDIVSHKISHCSTKFQIRTFQLADAHRPGTIFSSEKFNRMGRRLILVVV